MSVRWSPIVQNALRAVAPVEAKAPVRARKAKAKKKRARRG